MSGQPLDPGATLSVHSDATWEFSGKSGTDSGTYVVLQFPSGDQYLLITRDRDGSGWPDNCAVWQDNFDWRQAINDPFGGLSAPADASGNSPLIDVSSYKAYPNACGLGWEAEYGLSQNGPPSDITVSGQGNVEYAWSAG